MPHGLAKVEVMVLCKDSNTFEPLNWENHIEFATVTASEYYCSSVSYGRSSSPLVFEISRSEAERKSAGNGTLESRETKYKKL
jgi:hypothetical protein